MPRVQALASGRVLSAGATFVVGAGLGLYQLTSLVLGPVSSRQLDLSLTIPTVEAQDLSEPTPKVMIVVGTRAVPAVPASRTTRVALSPQAASASAPKLSDHRLPTAVPSPKSHRAGKKLPVDD